MDSRYDFIDRYIYALVDPRENVKIVYIGQSKEPEKRIKKHMKLNSDNVRKNNWIDELCGMGLEPKLVILEKVCLSQFCAFEYEMKWTVKYRDMGYIILSVSEDKINSIYSLH